MRLTCLYRKFKALAARSNQRDVEMTLLRSENIDQTLRFVLAGCFDVQDANLSTKVHQIHKHCPQLFFQVLPRSEQLLLAEEDDIAGEDTPLQDNSLSGIMLHVRMTQTEAELAGHPRTPGSAPDMSPFVLDWFGAYETDYNQRNPYVVESQRFKYWKHISFFDM